MGCCVGTWSPRSMLLARNAGGSFMAENTVFTTSIRTLRLSWMLRSLITEVVTWGIAGADLAEKARIYRASPTVRQCAYVAVDRAWVEIHTRDEGGRWVVKDVTGLEATCVFTGIDCSVWMAAIYEGALAR